MKTANVIFYLFLTTLLLQGCVLNFPDSITGNGRVVTQTRQVPEFSGIRVSSGIDVFLTQGEPYEVIVEADENLQDVIIVEVNQSMLTIRSEKNIRMAESKIVHVTCPVIERVDISSAGDLEGENTIHSEMLEINMSSAGDLNLDIDAERVVIDISSAGSANISGNTADLKADLSSAGDLNAFDLEASSADVSVSSAGNARVFVTEEARFHSSSAGDIHYRGDPQILEMSSSSAGTISKQ